MLTCQTPVLRTFGVVACFSGEWSLMKKMAATSLQLPQVDLRIPKKDTTWKTFSIVFHCGWRDGSTWHKHYHWKLTCLPLWLQFWLQLSMLLYVTLELGVSIYGCFLKWWYPQNTPKWSFLVGKPMVVGYHHFRKPPYVTVTSHEMFFGWDPDTRQQEL